MLENIACSGTITDSTFFLNSGTILVKMRKLFYLFIKQKTKEMLKMKNMKRKKGKCVTQQ